MAENNPVGGGGFGSTGPNDIDLGSGGGDGVFKAEGSIAGDYTDAFTQQNTKNGPAPSDGTYYGQHPPAKTAPAPVPPPPVKPTPVIHQNTPAQNAALHSHVAKDEF